MEQKRVSFKVAKALKEAGYPQMEAEGVKAYTEDGNTCLTLDKDSLAYPTYLDAWLWLWRKKQACIGILFDEGNCAVEIWSNKSFLRDFENKFDPEEAIIAAIEYIIDNNLLK